MGHQAIWFEFEIHYKPGASNRVADALTRREEREMEYGAILTTSAINWDEIRKENEEDKFIVQLRKDIFENEKSYPGYHVDDGRLYYGGRLVISRASSVIPFLLKVYHDSVIGGNVREIKTSQTSIEWYWVGMKQQVVQYVKECQVCQTQKASYQYPAGLLQPLPVPSQVWEDVTMDFVEALPKSKGWDTGGG